VPPSSTQPEPGPDFVAVLAAARLGSREALERLLGDFRNYLLLVSNRKLAADLAGKFGPSDVVQETLLEAQRDFDRFKGSTPEEWRAWLRQILLHNVANFARRFRDTAKRDLAREVPLVDVPLDELLRARIGEPTPSQVASAQEEARRMHEAVEQLPAHYREVLRLRHQEGLPFEEVARRLQRTVPATRKLWARAVRRLRDLVGGSPDDTPA
jgi:RNA polymerase sigma-70 factor (ECF subfamily)